MNPAAPKRDWKDIPAQREINPEWLALRSEEAVDPGQPIIDPHHHLWDPPGRRYLFDDLRADLDCGHDIRATVFIECRSMYRAAGPEEMRCVGEVEFIAGVAAQSDSGRYGDRRICAGIVGHVDYALGDRFEAVLEAQQAASGGRLRGFRGRSSSHADPGIDHWRTPRDVLAAAPTRQAVAVIARHGLSLDLWTYQTQAADVADLCRAYPNLTVIIDHAGGPLACGAYRQQAPEMFAAWQAGIRALAQLPNTVIKLSGLGMRFSGLDFYDAPLPPSSDELAAAIRPWFETCIDAFGPERAMFASNFPADKGGYSYGVMWNAFKKLTASCSPAERDALFHGTARRIYAI